MSFWGVYSWPHSWRPNTCFPGLHGIGMCVSACACQLYHAMVENNGVKSKHQSRWQVDSLLPKPAWITSCFLEVSDWRSCCCPPIPRLGALSGWICLRKCLHLAKVAAFSAFKSCILIESFINPFPNSTTQRWHKIICSILDDVLVLGPLPLTLETSVGDLDADSWLMDSPSPGHSGTYEPNQQMEHLSISASPILSVSLHFKWTNLNNELVFNIDFCWY